VLEIESHLRERIAAAGDPSNERLALETILTELGPPLRVAQAYSAERTIDEALATGRVVAVARGIWSLSVSTVSGFFAGLALLIGYAIGVSFLIIAVLKPIFPDNVGIFMSQGILEGIGARFPAPPEAPLGGYWVVPIALALGFAILVAVHRGARAFLGRWRRHRPSLSK
jgi:uncharacterized membrane protein